jgi:hypothetical protein
MSAILSESVVEQAAPAGRKDRQMSVGHFHIPGKATRREYAVYVMAARHRSTGQILLYVGKTGDNRDGCNPVISRVGNHFSYNKIHSQMRNHLPGVPTDYDFDFFYATFGQYVPACESRAGINLVNEMERQLNLLVQRLPARLLNPFEAATPLRKWQRDERAGLVTPDRLRLLAQLTGIVREFISSVADSPEPVASQQ